MMPFDVTLSELHPQIYDELMQIKEKLEEKYKDVCDISFTIEEGKLFILDSRIARRNPLANLRFAIQFFIEKKIDIYTFLSKVQLEDISYIIVPEIKNLSSLKLIGKGLPAGVGPATGKVTLSVSSVRKFIDFGDKIILVKNEINPEDIESARISQGILTTRGGMTSHAAMLGRGWNKPCVVGFGKIELFENFNEIRVDDECSKIFEGDWITIDGTTGYVYQGKGDVNSRFWKKDSDLVLLSAIIEFSIQQNLIPLRHIGKVWTIRDFFVHSIPFIGSFTSKIPVPQQQSKSFIPPLPETIKKIESELSVVNPEDYQNYNRILMSLIDNITRIMSSRIGIGQHIKYFRPLWDPLTCITRKNEYHSLQFVGLEFFGINRYVPNLIDIANITIFLNIELSENDECFLDYTNPKGESLVFRSKRICSYLLLINDAIVQYDDLPQLYNVIRRREYYWKWYKNNGVSYKEICEYIQKAYKKKQKKCHLSILSEEIRLINDGRITNAGLNLIGKGNRRKKYEFPEI